MQYTTTGHDVFRPYAVGGDVDDSIRPTRTSTIPSPANSPLPSLRVLFFCSYCKVPGETVHGTTLYMAPSGLPWENRRMR